MNWRNLLRGASLVLALAISPATVIGQSSPGFRTGQVPTAAQWNNAFAGKQDYLGSLTAIPLNTGNIFYGVSNVAVATLPTAVFDSTFCSTRGALLSRQTASWACLGVGTAGQAFVSAGAGADPAFGTLGIAGGGTAATTLTNHGILIGHGTSAVSGLACAVNQTLNWPTGTGADPACLTYGTAISQNTGTSGANVPLMNGANTWSGKQTFGALINQSSAAYASTTAGDVEFDGVAWAGNPVASDRGIVPTVHFLSLSATQTGSDVNTAQVWFPGGGATQYNAPASTAYFFHAQLMLDRTAGANSHTINVGLGGTATLTGSRWILGCTSTVGNVLGSFSYIRVIGSAPNATCTTASTATNENNIIVMRGIIRVSAAGGGTIIPQFTYSAAPGGAPNINHGSHFALYPIGVNSVLTVGNFN